MILKTPLRYPGGKSRAVPKLCQWLPEKIVEYREPFLGGGSVAIEMTKRFPDLPIWVNDLEYLGERKSYKSGNLEHWYNIGGNEVPVDAIMELDSREP